MDLVRPVRVNPFDRLLAIRRSYRSGSRPGGVGDTFSGNLAGLDDLNFDPAFSRGDGDAGIWLGSKLPDSYTPFTQYPAPSGSIGAGIRPARQKKKRIQTLEGGSHNSREVLLSIISRSISLVSDYYGITALSQSGELERIGKISDEELARVARGYEFAAETVAALGSDQGAREVLSLDDFEYSEFIDEFTVTEEDLLPAEHVTIGGGSVPKTPVKGN